MFARTSSHFHFCLFLALIGFCEVTLAADLTDLNALNTGTHQFTDENGQPFDAHVENIDGSGWLLVGRGREGWAFDSGGPGGTPAEVLSGLGTSAAFVPKALTATTINALMTQAGIDLTQVEIRMKRAANSTGTAYQQDLWRPITQSIWTWDLAASPSGYEVVHEILPAGTFDGNVAPDGHLSASRKNTSDNYVLETNDARRLFTFAWGSHNSKQGFSYGITVRGSNSLGNFLWENSNEAHAIPYTEVYIRDHRPSEIVVTDAANSGAGSLRDAIAEIAPGGSITFDSSLDGATIKLTSGQLKTTRSVAISASSLPQGLTIKGLGDDFTPGAVFSRVFWICSGTAKLTGLEITDGFQEDSIGGGGILVSSGATLLLENSTLTQNYAEEKGGAILNEGTLRITQCTFSGNSSTYEGGAIWTDGVTEIDSSTLSGNDADQGGAIGIGNGGSATLINSIIAGNTVSSQFQDIYAMPPNSLVNNGGNLLGSNESLSTQFPTGPLVGTAANPLDPRLLPLSNNGGPTQTMRLAAMSPARDHGILTANITFTDQRGFERVIGASIDIGAYESPSAYYYADGLHIFAEVPGTLQPPLEFEISADPNFSAATSISGLAGSGDIGYLDGPSADAEFSFPSDIATDASGNLFIADTANNRIRLRSPGGQISTIAGNGNYGFVNGLGANAEFALPAGLKVGPDGNLYVADTFNHCIRKLIRPATAGASWTVTTLAGNGLGGRVDGQGTVARFSYPHGISFNLSDTGVTSGDLYVADSGNHMIRKVSQTGVVSTFAGNGVAGIPTNTGKLEASFDQPFSLVFDSMGENLYIADRNNDVIRKIDLTTSDVTTIAGNSQGFQDGMGLGASFNAPVALAIDAQDNLYLSDEFNHAIRKIDTSTFAVTTVIGTGSAGAQDGILGFARLHCPSGLIVDPNGDVLIADTQNHQLRIVTSKTISVPAVLLAQDPFQDGLSLISADINLASVGLARDTTYYFRWRSPTGPEQQISGQSFETPESSFLFWQFVHFGDDALDPSIAGPMADPNGDCVPNLIAYASGLDPFQVTELERPVLIPDTNALVFEYTKSFAAADLTFRLERSIDLEDWDPVSAPEQIISANNLTQRIRIRVPQSSDQAAEFVRLAIELQ